MKGQSGPEGKRIRAMDREEARESKRQRRRELAADAEITRRLEDVSGLPTIVISDLLPPIQDLSDKELKIDHENRPLWVTPTGHIYLDAHSPLYDEASAFLIQIAEPLRRPEYIHEFRLDKEALFAAASMDMGGADIASQAGLALHKQDMGTVTGRRHSRRDSCWTTPSYQHIILLIFHLGFVLRE